jgi:hypothetical protein
MPDYEFETCPAHDEVVKSLTRNSVTVKTLLGLVALACGVVAFCVTMAMAASDDAGKIRHDLDVHTAGQEQRAKNIEDGLDRIDGRLDRIDNRLEELIKDKAR